MPYVFAAKPYDFAISSYDFTTDSYEFTTKTYEFTTNSYEFATKTYEFTINTYEFTTNTYEFTTNTYEFMTNSYEFTTDSYVFTINSYEFATKPYMFTDKFPFWINPGKKFVKEDVNEAFNHEHIRIDACVFNVFALFEILKDYFLFRFLRKFELTFNNPFMMRYSVVCVFLFICILGSAQDTIFNQTDKQGQKQGFWKTKYPNGTIRYTAFFSNDKPVGVMKRYFDDNSLMAEMYFFPNSTRVQSKMYFQQGPLAAEGIYSQKDVKDSVWNYYSYYTKTLVRKETYRNGKLDGSVLGYYKSGQISEERKWKNGIADGFWHQYYDNGVLKLSINCIEGKRNGEFVSNYPDGKPEWKGAYVNDRREGKWENFNPSGAIETTIEYKNGVAANQAELNAKQQEILQQMEKQQGKIPEPDENNIMTPAQK